MDTRALADLEHANMIEAMTSVCANVAGASVWRADGVAVIATGLPFVFFNQVAIDGDATAPAAVDSAVAFMRKRGGPFVVDLRSGRDDRFAPLMTDLGLVAVGERPWMPGMAWYPLPAEVAVPDLPGHEIRRISDQAGLDDHIRTGAIGLELPEEVLRAVVLPTLLSDANAAIYVGYTDGQPISTGFGVRTGRTIGVYNIATVEPARGHGYGTAITRRVVADGVAAGCDVAALQSSDMGFSIYERLGFRTVVDYLGYVDPAAGAT